MGGSRTYKNGALAQKVEGDRTRHKYQTPLEVETTQLPKIPFGWVWASFDALTTKLTSGSRAWRKHTGAGAGKFMLVQNVRERQLDITAPVYVNPPKGLEAERTRIEKGDILITIVGNAGVTASVNCDIGEAYVSQSVALVRPLPQINFNYLEYYLTTPDWGAKFLGERQYGIGRGHLLLSHIREIPIAIPPLEEQSAIVAVIDEKLSVAEVLEKEIDSNLKHTDHLRQSILAKAF